MSISAISAGLSAIVALKDLFSTDSNKEEQRRNLEIVWRQYSSEVFYNAQILDTINFNGRLNDDRLGTIRAIAPLLKNEYGKTIVVSIGLLGKTLNEIEKQYMAIKDDSLVNKKGEKTRVTTMILFTVNRIEVLKNLALMPDDKFLRRINVSVRLKNIRTFTLEINNALRQSLERVLDQTYS